MMDGVFPVVGRRRQRDALHGAVRALSAGAGRAVAVTGEPGIGKTTLLTLLAADLRAGGVPLSRTRGAVPPTPAPGTAVLVDDLHRLPDEAVPVLEDLIALTADVPVLLAVGYRPRQVSPRLAAALAFATATGALDEWPVEPMSMVDARALVGADAARIHAEAGGNPLYLGILAGTGTVAALVGELSALTPVQRRIAQAAAVLGEPFPPDLPGLLAGTEPARTHEAAAALVALDLLRPALVAPLLTFRHPVVARVVYDTIHIGQRRADHLAADAELARQGAPAVRRARHVVRAPDRARPDHHQVLVAAARKVLDTDPVTAAAWLSAARELLPEDDRRGYPTDLLLARAYLLAGRPADSRELLHRMLPTASPGDLATTAAYCAQAERLLGRYPEAAAFVAEGLAATHPAATAATLLIERADLAIERMEFAAADRHARLAARIARGCGDRAAEASALSQAALARAYDGDLVAARRTLAAAIRLVDGMSDAVLIGNLPCLYLTGMTEALMEHLPDAERHLARGVSLSRRTGQGHVLPGLLKTLGDVQLRRGRLLPALGTLDEAAFVSERNEQAPTWAIVTALRAETLLWLHGRDDAGDAVAAAERSVAACDGLRWGWAVVNRCRLGMVLIHAGERARGRRTLLAAAGGETLPRLASWRRPRWWDDLTVAAVDQRALPAAGRYADLADASLAAAPSGIREGFARRTRARASAAHGDTGRAIEAAAGAADRFTASDVRLELGRTLVAAAEAYLAAGRPADAAGPLDQAHELADRCGSVRLAEHVADTRRRLATTAPTLAALTPREREVAALASTGATSNEIASRLFLSVRTVDSHLGRVYRKLGVSTRAALTGVLLDPGARSANPSP